MTKNERARETAPLFTDDTPAATNVVTLAVAPDPIRLAVERIQAEGPVLTRVTAELAIRANAYTKVTTQELLTGAEQLATEVQSHGKAITGLHAPVVEHWHRKHDDACKARKAMLDPQAAIYAKLKAEITRYLRAEAEQRQRANEQARLDAMAQQLAREQQQQKMMGPAAPSFAPQPFAAPPIQRPEAQLTSSAKRYTWKYEVTDIMATLRAVVAGKIPLEAIQINDAFMCTQAEQYRTSLRYPGIRIYEDVNVTIRR